jgi:hypothetical protein
LTDIKKSYTFAARKRGREKGERDGEAGFKNKKKIKFAIIKKVLTFAVPKERDAEKQKYRKRFSV